MVRKCLRRDQINFGYIDGFWRINEASNGRAIDRFEVGEKIDCQGIRGATLMPTVKKNSRSDNKAYKKQETGGDLSENPEFKRLLATVGQLTATIDAMNNKEAAKQAVNKTAGNKKPVKSNKKQQKKNKDTRETGQAEKAAASVTKDDINKGTGDAKKQQPPADATDNGNKQKAPKTHTRSVDTDESSLLAFYNRLTDNSTGPKLHKDLYLKQRGLKVIPNPGHMNQCLGHAALSTLNGKKVHHLTVAQYYDIAFLPFMRFFCNLSTAEQELLIYPRAADGNLDPDRNTIGTVSLVRDCKKFLSEVDEGRSPIADISLLSIWAFLLNIDCVHVIGLNPASATGYEGRLLSGHKESVPALSRRPVGPNNNKSITVFHNAEGEGHFEGLLGGDEDTRLDNLPSPKEMIADVVTRLRSLMTTTMNSERPFIVDVSLLDAMLPKKRSSSGASRQRAKSVVDLSHIENTPEVTAAQIALLQAQLRFWQAKQDASSKKASPDQATPTVDLTESQPDASIGDNDSSHDAATGDNTTSGDSNDINHSDTETDVVSGLRGGADRDTTVLLNQIMVAINAIANASPCDDLFFDNVFRLVTDHKNQSNNPSTLTDKEPDRRPTALASALVKIEEDMRAIVTTTRMGGHRTKKAGEFFDHICNLLQDDYKSDPNSVEALAAKLTSYAPVLKLLLPSNTDIFSTHTLTKSGKMTNATALAITNEINGTAASSERRQ
jgi:hypothetical protein